MIGFMLRLGLSEASKAQSIIKIYFIDVKEGEFIYYCFAFHPPITVIADVQVLLMALIIKTLHF